ncbi:oxidoreductase [Dyella sp. C9]|uniref:oxidoreductase n=1 Tax=Dyella sp. C9 TaxID=2202154 RepID=UPI001E350C4F|nr:oxidoreductase [Dyella sp. C9]
MPSKPSTAPMRVALIGYGYAGKTFHAPLIRSVAGLELALVASRDAAKVHADLPDVEVVADVQSALHDPRISLVVIASPNDTHAPLARAALETGKHVVVDKPFALDATEARALAVLAQRQGRVLSVFQNRRWDSDFLGVKQVLEQGLLGEVMHFESHIDRFRPQVRARWREQRGAGSGLWYDLGPHLVDQALLLFGLPQRVLASMAVQRVHGEVTDWAHVVLEYGARRVILHASMLVAGGSPRFVLHGTGGSLVKALPDRQEAQLLAGLHPGADGWGVDADAMQLHDGSDHPVMIATPRGDQRRYYEALYEALTGQGVNPVTPWQAVSVMAVLDAAIACATTGNPVAPAWSTQEREAWPQSLTTR